MAVKIFDFVVVCMGAIALGNPEKYINMFNLLGGNENPKNNISSKR